VKLSDVIKEGPPGYLPETTIYTITITNTFLPRQYQLPKANACLYNSQLRKSVDTGVVWGGKSRRKDFGMDLNTVEIGRETKTVELKLMPHGRFIPSPEGRQVKIPEEPEVYDKLLLFLDEGPHYEYVNCYELQPEDFSEAINILITQD